jgi:hypothetical protein
MSKLMLLRLQVLKLIPTILTCVNIGVTIGTFMTVSTTVWIIQLSPVLLIAS